MNMMISFIIITWNDRERLMRCLNSIYEHKPIYPFEIIVVDNASTDDTREMLALHFQYIHVIKNKYNSSGFKSRNQGLNRAQGKYVFFLDSDTELVEDTATHLTDFMEAHPHVAVSGPKILYADRSLQLTCRTFPSFSILCTRLFWGDTHPRVQRYLMSTWSHDSTRSVDWVITAGFFIRKKAIIEINYFDEKYMPMYYDDIDTCFRLKQKGWSIMYVPSTTMIHHYQRKSSKKKLSRFLVSHIYNAIRFLCKKLFVDVKKQVYWLLG